MSLPVTLFGILIETVCGILLIKSFQGKSLVPNITDLFFITIQFLWTPLPVTYSIVVLFSGQIVYFIYSFYQTDKKIIPTVFLLCPTFIFLYSTEGISSLLLFPVMNLLSIDYLPPMGSITTFIIIMLIIRFFPCALFYQKIIKGNPPFKFLILNSYLVALIITLFYKTHMNDIYEYIVLVFITLFVILFVNVCVFYYENKLREKQQELLTYEKNRPIFENLIDDIRSSQHEYDNRIQSIALLPTVCQDYESLKDSLEKYTSSYSVRQKCYPLLSLNMPLIASTLYNLDTIASQKKITILYDIPNPNLECRISEHIMVDFLYIITQNAIEASKKNDYIYVVLVNQNGNFYFEVQNPVEEKIPPEEIAKFFHKGYTTKTDESYIKPHSATPHGYGLYELLNNVEKLGGAVSADCVYSENKYWMVFSLTL